LRKEAVVALRAWLREWRGQPAQPLSPNARGQPLSQDGVEYLLTKHAVVARTHCPSLRSKRISPHVLRHSLAMELLQSGVDQPAIALSLGHETLDTAQVYVHPKLQPKAKALAPIHNPSPETSDVTDPVTGSWPSSRAYDYAGLDNSNNRDFQGYCTIVRSNSA
jgi:site-specific recombinase XerD